MKAIEEYYHALAPKLTNYLMGNGLAYADTCEIVQETFLRLWKMRDSLRDDDSAVSGLVYTIARNLRNDRARRGKFEVFATIEADGEEKSVAPEPSVDPAPSPSDADYLRQRIRDALVKLPPVLREAYTLFQIAEMSVREVARQTGASENLVKVRVFRAKQKLQEELKDLKELRG